VAIEKKILKNRPFVDAQGQYNFEDGVNIGVDKQGRVGVENDLYTISDNVSDIYDSILNPTVENINLYTGLGTLQFNHYDSWFMNRGYDSSISFEMFFIDDVISDKLSNYDSVPLFDDYVDYEGGNILNFRSADSDNGVINCGSRHNSGNPKTTWEALLFTMRYRVDINAAPTQWFRFSTESNGGSYSNCTLDENSGYTHYIANPGGNCYAVSSPFFEKISNEDFNNLTINEFPFVTNNTSNGAGYYDDLNAGYSDDYIMDPWSFINHPDSTDFDLEGAFYFGYFMKDVNNPPSAGRPDPLWIFRLPKRDIYDVWLSGEERTITWGASATDENYVLGNGDASQIANYDYYGCGFERGSSGDDQSGFNVGKLSITIKPPTDYSTGIEYYSDAFDNYFFDDNNIYLSSPLDNKSTATMLDELDVGDFRPISEITVNDLDLQSYYYSQIERTFTSAPSQISLKFSIADINSFFDVNYIESTDWGDIKFKAFVVNWDWRDNEPETLDEIVDDFPNNEPDLFIKRNQDNTYNYIDVLNGELTNNYQTFGTKIIKAIVFSYIDNTDDTSYYQPLIWKLLTIKININTDPVYEQDFGDIGGVDYTFIPWPQTTPIIGGLSEESTYINTLQSVIKQNQFREDEQLDKTLALNSIENDELGDYFGKSNIAQTRYFKDGSYDMNKLLMLPESVMLNDTSGDEIIQESEFNPYDSDYWDGESLSTSYPQESCVGTLFINDNMNQELRQNILIEMNMDEVDERTIRDSSGNGFKGVLIGDYAIKKDTKDISIRKESEINLPETDSEDKAF